MRERAIFNNIIKKETTDAYIIHERLPQPRSQQTITTHYGIGIRDRLRDFCRGEVGGICCCESGCTCPAGLLLCCAYSPKLLEGIFTEDCACVSFTSSVCPPIIARAARFTASGLYPAFYRLGRS